jgi:hypothetical protein
MRPDARVWCVNKQWFEIFNVVVEPFGSPSIWPMHHNVFCMALA